MGTRRFNHRAGIRITAAATVGSLALLAGCASAPWPWGTQTAGPAKSDAKATTSTPKSSSAEADAESLKHVMSELKQVKALDPAAQEELAADLKQVNPGLRATVMQTFLAEAAYKRREEQREAERQNATGLPSGNLRSELDHETTQKQESRAAISAGDAPAAKSIAADQSETRFESRAPAMQSSPGAADLQVSPDEAALALAPEPPLAGGITAATATVNPDPAGATARPAEPPAAVALLAATRTKSPANAVALAGFNSPLGSASPQADPDWQSHLTSAIRSIESESKAGSKNESDIALQARLRMLYLLAGRRDDAMRPLPAAPQATQDYWKSQIYGISTWMDSEKTPDTARRAAETKRILSEALAQLGETAPLAVRNATFCTEVFRFGSFDAVKSTEFSAGQKVLLYAEVDNLHVESTAKGYHWAVKVSGQIFDRLGSRMVDYGSTAADEFFQTPRHDFFVSKLYYLPRLVPGRYSLQLTVEDTLGHKVGQSSIDFTVKGQ
jgi:hypothetical protein